MTIHPGIMGASASSLIPSQGTFARITSAPMSIELTSWDQTIGPCLELTHPRESLPGLWRRRCLPSRHPGYLYQGSSQILCLVLVHPWSRYLLPGSRAPLCLKRSHPGYLCQGSGHSSLPIFRTSLVALPITRINHFSMPELATSWKLVTCARIRTSPSPIREASWLPVPRITGAAMPNHDSSLVALPIARIILNPIPKLRSSWLLVPRIKGSSYAQSSNILGRVTFYQDHSQPHA